MKLLFKKGDDSQISVFQDLDGHEVAFSYVDMIKALILSKKMADPVVSNGFTDAEMKSIRSMVTLINKEVSVTLDSDHSELIDHTEP